MLMKEQYAVMIGDDYITTIYKNSTSETRHFDDALKCDTIDEAKLIMQLAIRRNSKTTKQFSIRKRVVTFENVEL